MQVKLLRAVQDGEIDPVGARAPVKVDIRLISATHRDLLQRVRDGLFREDLFYRLHVFPIFVPPLRDRRDDIHALVEHFVARFARSQPSLKARTVSGAALAMLRAYDWPGNIRQLENAVFRAMVLCDGEMLSVDDFPQIRAQVEDIAVIADQASAPPGEALPAIADRREGAAGETLPNGRAARESPAQSRFGVLSALDSRGNVRTLADVELEMIKLAIDHYHGQMSEVARRLGIGRSTLYRKLKEYGIDPETGRAEKGGGLIG